MEVLASAAHVLEKDGKVKNEGLARMFLIIFF